MRAGLLTENIEIITPTITKNAYGEESTTWTTKYNTRAHVVHKSGGRRVSNDDIIYDYTKTIQIRYYIDIDEYDRIKWEGRIYRILDVEPDKQLQCKIINMQQVIE